MAKGITMEKRERRKGNEGQRRRKEKGKSREKSVKRKE